jgi:hypothetical protein
MKKSQIVLAFLVLSISLSLAYYADTRLFGVLSRIAWFTAGKKNLHELSAKSKVYVQNELGFSLRYPAEWYIEELGYPGSFLILSDEKIIPKDADKFETGQGILNFRVHVMGNSNYDFSPVPGIEFYIKYVGEFNPVYREQAHVEYLSDKKFAIATFDVTVSNRGPNIFALHYNKNMSIEVFGFTSPKNEIEFRKIFEAILASIEFE